MTDKLNKEEIWSKCLLFIKNRIQETAFQTWFDGVQISSISNEDVTLLVPNKFHYEWLESKYRTLIDEAINQVTSKSLIINYTVPITSKSSQEIPSFSVQKSAEEILALELILAAKNDSNSFSIKKKFEQERMAMSAR